MKKRSADEGVPESDCVEDAPHPRHNHLLFGHGDAERQLLEAYRSGRLPQAWIIGGQEGVGKATLAWRFARFLFANPLFDSPGVARASDLSVSPDDPVSRRIDAMAIGDLALLRREWNEKTKKHFTEIRMDDVRHALELFHHAAGEGGWRICIVDCAEDLNRSGANALLKVMEEPPPRSLFLIISHRPARILPTIRSRCRMLQLEPLAADEVSQTVRSLGEPWSHMGAEIDAAAQRAGGSVKQALRYLDKDRFELAESAEAPETVPSVVVEKVALNLANTGCNQVHCSIFGIQTSATIKRSKPSEAPIVLNGQAAEDSSMRPKLAGGVLA
jgi:DNA polymerase-3 subunit delta'